MQRQAQRASLGDRLVARPAQAEAARASRWRDVAAGAAARRGRLRAVFGARRCSSACSPLRSSSGAGSPARPSRCVGRRRGPDAAAPRPLRSPPPRVTPIVGPGPEIVRPALDGLVPYEPGKPVETVQRELGLDHVVKLASNEGPFGPFPAAIEAIERALARVEPLPGRRLLPPPRDARGASRRALRGGDRRRGRRRGDRLRLPGDARPGRRGRDPVAVVPELRPRPAQGRLP